MSLSNNGLRTALRIGLAASLLVAAAAGRPLALAADGTAPAAAAPPSIAAQLVAAFDRLFKGPYPGARAIHAKGIVLRGNFTAGPDAESLSAAEYLRANSTPVPVIVRFSAFSGIPSQNDGKAGTTPSGMAIKFLLANGVDTDIVAHSYNGFPAATPQEFLEYIDALASPDAAARTAFLAAHPAAQRFAADPKPTPVSFATEAFYGVDAFRFINAAAISRFGRYRIEPIAGVAHLSAAQEEDTKPDYLRDELRRRIAEGPVGFRLFAQIAAPQDLVTDPATPWPADRPEILLGTLSLTQVMDDRSPEVQKLFFSPMNLVPGIAPSADPLLAARTRSYAISYRRRLAGE